MSAITTHVLDTSRGRPAAGVPVILERRSHEGDWKELAHGKTNADGRAAELLPKGAPLESGTYRLTFDAAAYFRSHNAKGFYPYVSIVFEAEGGEHYHVPLLLSPFGYSTYRGS